jgi:rhomboid family GlyGly-CTERM serine protease
MKTLRVPLLLFALPAVLLAFAQARQGLFLLERSASGELWRLWSGHWVHFSASHLGWNLAVILVVGAWLEHLRPGLLLRHALLAAPLLSIALLAFEPNLRVYGGLSGLATGVVVLLALHQLRTPDSVRLLWAGVLALVAVKAFSDTSHASPWLARYEQTGVRTSAFAHAAGAISATLHYLTERLWARFTRAVP